ncbi:hypothetical protein R1flu_022413 [Riccia fluitans]|uniref:Uncharacterized protein n=1 Tax=Riccia fluitans TaxID=41844 RepID=A0ABD1ZS52_9MARC
MLSQALLDYLDEWNVYDLCDLYEETIEYICNLYPDISPFHEELVYEIAKRLRECGDLYVKDSIEEDFPDGFPTSPPYFDQGFHKMEISVHVWKFSMESGNFQFRIATGGEVFAGGGEAITTGGIGFASGGEDYASGDGSFTTGDENFADSGETFAIGGNCLASDRDMFACGGKKFASCGKRFASGGERNFI